MRMTGLQTRQGLAHTFGCMRRPGCDVTASQIANTPVEAWEAPDGTILVWPVGNRPFVQRERTSDGGYRYIALDTA